MKALLLAAGKATRLGALSQNTPKCLQRVGGEALLDRIVRQLQEAGVNGFLINTHHLAHKVRTHIEASSWREAATLVHEQTLLGTLGTLSANANFFGKESAWVLHADNFIEGPLSHLRRAFDQRPEHVHAAMLTFLTNDPSSCGVVVKDSNGVVLEFHEKAQKPPTTEASAATFLFDSQLMRVISILGSQGTDIAKDLLPKLLGQILAVPSLGRVVDIGTPERLALARSLADSQGRYGQEAHIEKTASETSS